MQANLSRNVVANLANAGVGMGLALFTTPLIIHRVGTAGYGVWTLMTAFVLYSAIAEAGIGPAAQRFIAVAHGRRDLATAARILWATLALYVSISALACLVLQLLAGPIVDLFDIPSALRDDAVGLLRIVGFALIVGLAAIAVGNVQQGLGRFEAVAVATGIGSVAYFIAVVVLVGSNAGLVELGYAVLGQQVLFLILRLATVRDVLRSARPGFVTRAELRELLGFSAKLQVSVLSLLINGQSDKVVTGLVAPASTVGQLGIAAQAGEAARLIGGAALTPMISRLSAIVGSDDRPRLHQEFGRLNRVWMLAVTGATLILALSFDPIIRAWLGSGYGDAILYGEFLVLAYGIGLLPGTRLAYLRATNQIGLEALVGAVTIGANIIFTVPLAVAFGATGVVAGTLGAYVLGTVLFVWRFDRMAPPAPATPYGSLLKAVALAVMAGLLSLGWGLAMVGLLPAGLALVPVSLGVVAALGGYLAITTGMPLSPSGIKAMLA